jgi:hypothetical protein
MFGFAANSGVVGWSNYLGYDAGCSGIGDLWPAQGTQEATGNWTTSGTSLTINSGTSPTIGQYANGSGFTQATQVISGTSPNFTLSNSEPSLTETMTSGPIQSRIQGFFGMSSGGGFANLQWNYVDKVGTLAIFPLIGPISEKYNFVEVQDNPANHTDGLLSNEAGESWASGVNAAIYPIAEQIQDANTSLYDSTSIAGIQNGGATGAYAEGGGTADLVFFGTSSTAGNASTGYYIEYLYVEHENNILIANISTNNNKSYPTGNAAITSAYGITYNGQQGVAPYWGSIASSVISGNLFDPTGSFGCAVTTGTITTTPGGATTFSSTLTGKVLGVDLLDGSNVTLSSCHGAFP